MTLSLMVMIGWLAIGALLGLVARTAIVVHQRVGLARAMGAGAGGAFAGGVLTTLATGGPFVISNDACWMGGVGGALVGLAVMALVTTHFSRTAKLG